MVTAWDLLASLYAFSALRTLALSSFRPLVLDDAAYVRMAATWPELRCLKVGTTAVYKKKPVASVGAVIIVSSTNVAYRVRQVNSASAVRDRDGCGPAEGIGVVFKIGDAPVGNDPVQEGAI